MNDHRFLEVQRVLETGLGIEIRRSEGPESPLEAVDYLCEAQFEDRIWHLAIEMKSSAGRSGEEVRDRQVDLRDRWPDLVPVLAIPRLSKTQRKKLQALGVNHLDFGGSIWIRFPGLFVDIEGRRRRSRPLGRSQERNPFSKRASLVARVLLESPTEVWGVRTLSREASLSVGYVSEIMKTLVAREYAKPIEGGFRLNRAGALLADWSAAYSWEDNRIRSFFAPFEKEDLVQRAWEVLHELQAFPALTLLAALNRLMDYVVDDQVHFYATESAYAIEKKLIGELHAEPVERGGNLHILKPYYGPATRYGADDQGPVPVVSDIQLFLDLVHYPVRGPESADMLLRKRLTQSLELSRRDLEALEEDLGLR